MAQGKFWKIFQTTVKPIPKTEALSSFNPFHRESKEPWARSMDGLRESLLLHLIIYR
jgi:hypothetical protein